MHCISFFQIHQGMSASRQALKQLISLRGKRFAKWCNVPFCVSAKNGQKTKNWHTRKRESAPSMNRTYIAPLGRDRSIRWTMGAEEVGRICGTRFRATCVDRRRLELLTSSMPWRRSTRWANGPIVPRNPLVFYRLSRILSAFLSASIIMNIWAMVSLWKGCCYGDLYISSEFPQNE